MILTDATIVVNGTELSRDANQVNMDLPDDEVDTTTFKGGKYRKFEKGLSDSTITVTFFNSYEAQGTDETLWPLKLSNDPFKMYIQPFDGVPSADNPAYGLNALLYNYSPISGSVGEASNTDVNFRNAASTGIEKLVSPAELAAFLAAS